MRRRHGHAAFAASSVFWLAIGLWAAWNLREAGRVDAAILSGAGGAPTELAESRLAYAQHLSAQGNFDGALAGYQAIVRGGRADLRRIALYDLANLHLRRALGEEAGNSTNALPLIEIAKQHYRDLLRDDPEQWDARYNLELALRVAPENFDAVDDESPPPDNQESRRSTNAGARMDLP